MDIAAEPVEFRHDNRRNLVVVIPDAPCGLERSLQLRPMRERVPLRALYLDEHQFAALIILGDLEPLAPAELCDGLLLRFEPQAAPALLLCGDADVGDAGLRLACVLPAHHDMCPVSCYNLRRGHPDECRHVILALLPMSRTSQRGACYVCGGSPAGKKIDSDPPPPDFQKIVKDRACLFDWACRAREGRSGW